MANLTMKDRVDRELPGDKGMAKIVEQLTETNDPINDAILIPGNSKTGHITTTRTGLPDSAWRKINQGVQPTKSQTAQVTDTAGQLTAYSQVDKTLADLQHDTKAFRLSEDVAHLEGMTQNVATSLFYGDTSIDPEQFLGLAPRYNSLSAGNAENIIDAGGTGSDNTSIWLVAWGEDTCHTFFPEGLPLGFKMTDKGVKTVTDASGGLFEAYRTHFEWNIGLSLRDWRYVVRICNIDTSDLLANTGSNLDDLLVQAIEKLPSIKGKISYYMNKQTRTAVRREAIRKSNVQFSYENRGGKIISSFSEFPIGISNAILNTEARVV